MQVSDWIARHGVWVAMLLAMAGLGTTAVILGLTLSAQFNAWHQGWFITIEVLGGLLMVPGSLRGVSGTQNAMLILRSPLRRVQAAPSRRRVANDAPQTREDANGWTLNPECFLTISRR